MEEPQYYSDIRENGYHIYSFENAEDPDYYQEDLQDYPGIRLKELQPGEIITIRAYFGVGSGVEMEVDSGFVDLQVEHIEVDRVLAVIVSELPEEYVLSQGDSLEVFEEEILCKNEMQ